MIEIKVKANGEREHRFYVDLNGEGEKSVDEARRYITKNRVYREVVGFAVPFEYYQEASRIAEELRRYMKEQKPRFLNK